MKEKELLKRILDLVWPYRIKLVTAMICMVLVAGLSTMQAYMVKPLLDKIFVEKNEFMFRLLPPGIVLLFIVKGCFHYVYSYLMENVGHSIIKHLRLTLYHHIILQPLGFFHKNSTGELISRIMNDIGLLQYAVSSSLVTIIRDFFRVIGLLGYIFYQDWKLSLMSIIFLPLSSYAITAIGRRYRRYSTNMQQTAANSTKILQETISGNRIIKAFCTEQYEADRFHEKLETLFMFTMKDARLKSFAKPLMEVMGGVGIALIMWYGGSQVMHGHSTPGTFFSFLAAIIMIYEPIKSLSNVNNTIQQGMAASARIFQVLDIPNEAMIEEKRGGQREIGGLEREIEFRDVSFSYDGKEEVLKEINFTVPKGQIAAFVGASGAGKTTLVNLLPRFHEVSGGAILIDGVDIRDCTLRSLRSLIGIVSQDTILFDDTVRNNIAYGRQDHDEEAIIAAAKAAFAHDFIMELPEQYETVIGESGSRLSGGQRQRLAIARALLKNAPILVLDEATSALDTESEREVQKALENLMQDRTTFVIAHRLSTIRKAHHIIVMDQGRIAEEGDHESLLARDGVYKKLHSLQHHP